MHHGKPLVQLVLGLGLEKGNAGGRELVRQLDGNVLLQFYAHIGLINEYKCRNAVKFKKLPEGSCVVLHPVRCADYKNGVVKQGKGSLRFGGEVNVTRGVEKDEIAVLA